jgi:copper chaperone
MENTAMETLTIGIKGMTCGGCVKSVTNVLQQIKGVSSVDVSLEQNRANITFDPLLAQPAQFKSAIEDAGFDVV